MGVLEEVFESYADRLMKVFQYYCSYGEPLNNNKLKSSKFLKFLRDCNLLLRGVLRTNNTGIQRSNENYN
jgi:hypothetical protein